MSPNLAPRTIEKDRVSIVSSQPRERRPDQTPDLIRVCRSGSVQDVTRLLHDDLDLMEVHGESNAFVTAAENGSVAIVEMFLEHPAIEPVLERWGRKALLEAQKNGHSTVIRRILAHPVMAATGITVGDVPIGKQKGCVPPCWDETDDGVPPPCRGNPHCWKVFNPRNTCTNHNRCCWVFGNVGWKSFDYQRKVFMGFVMWSTLLSIFITAYGCFALSTDTDIILNTHWSSATFRNATDGPLYKVYIGLSSAVVLDGAGAVIHTPKFGNPNAAWTAQEMTGIPLVDEELEVCRETAAGNQLGAFMSCFTLLFALLGTINRMKFSADTNIQKSLGMLTDTGGAVSLILTMVGYASKCYSDLPIGIGPAVFESRSLGPGFYCYVVCAVVGVIRASCHWVTPVPGHGAGACGFVLPAAVIPYFDANGDGKFDMDDVRLMLRAGRNTFDLNGDGKIDCADAKILCCPCVWPPPPPANMPVAASFGRPVKAVRIAPELGGAAYKRSTPPGTIAEVSL